MNDGEVKFARSEMAKRAPLPPVLRKNVILRCLHVRVAQECDFKGVGSGGSVRGTQAMHGKVVVR